MKTYPAFMPCFSVKNARQAIAFYEKAFGFTWDNEKEAPTNETDILHVEMRYKDFICFHLKGVWHRNKSACIIANPQPRDILP